LGNHSRKERGRKALKPLPDTAMVGGEAGVLLLTLCAERQGDLLVLQSPVQRAAIARAANTERRWLRAGGRCFSCPLATRRLTRLSEKRVRVEGGVEEGTYLTSFALFRFLRLRRASK
jgi:hypothetical protein